MLNRQNIAAVILVALGTAGFKWNNAIASLFHSLYSMTPGNKSLNSSLSNQVNISAPWGELTAISVELFSIAMIVTGLIWLMKQASRRSLGNRVVFDFSKKNKEVKSIVK